MGILVYFATAFITMVVCVIAAFAAGINTMSGAAPVVIVIISLSVATFVQKKFNAGSAKSHDSRLKKIPVEIKRAADENGVTPFEYIKPQVHPVILDECEKLRCITTDLERYLNLCVRSNSIPKAYMNVLYAEYSAPKNMYGNGNAWSKYNEDDNK